MDLGANGPELTHLLAPIPGAAPAGGDPREDVSPASLYYRLRDARAEARADERRSDAVGDGDIATPVAWATIRSLAEELLAAQSKDLEVAAWYTEALLRAGGLAGLARGTRLMTGLVERYWDVLHPMPDEDGVARLVAAVAGLNGEGADGTLIQPLRKQKLFQRADGSAVAFWQYEQSAELAGIGDAARRQQRLAAGVTPFETIETEARGAAAAFTALHRDAAEAAAAWQALGVALDARAGAASPSMARVRDLLAEFLRVAERYAIPTPAGPAIGAAPTNATTTADAMPSRIRSREDALRSLNEIAEFFRHTEPHSPLAYTLSETVRRARLPWPELLEEIVPDHDSRAAILNTLGIRPPSPSE